jgi:hypothetical protein
VDVGVKDFTNLLEDIEFARGDEEVLLERSVDSKYFLILDAVEFHN